MRTSNLAVPLILLGLLYTADVGADSVAIPKRIVAQPSQDLLDQSGQTLNLGQATDKAKRGEDLSLLNPEKSRLWQNQSYPAVDRTLAYPAELENLEFLSHEMRLPRNFTYAARVKAGSTYYRMTLSRFTLTTLMRSALMRKLGYFVPSPKFYSKARIRFSSLKEMREFWREAQGSTQTSFADRKWVLEDNQNKLAALRISDELIEWLKAGDFSDADKRKAVDEIAGIAPETLSVWLKTASADQLTLTLSSVLLEPAQTDYFDSHLGIFPSPETKTGRDVIAEFSKYRAYRALVIPLVAVDVPESVNRFSPQAGSIKAETVLLNHPSASSFGACTYEDARWIARRMQKLSAQDWREVVAASNFPPEIAQVVETKILHRVQHLMSLFDLPSNLPQPELRFDTASGLVKEGKVTQEFVSGYPFRFSHGDRQDPFTDADLGRYMTLEAQSTGIKEFLNKINERLVARDVNDLAMQRQEDVKRKVIEHIKTKPLEPLYQDVEVWGGPVGNLDLGASRHITTGTYFDSTAPIQLVDNVSVGASIGYFAAVDGYNNMFPSFGSNVSLYRNYIHVNPIESVEKASHIPWDQLLVGNFMNKLGEVLAQPDTNLPATEAGPAVADKKVDAIDKFFQELKSGEVFTITDSLGLSTWGQIVSPLDVLFGLESFGYLNSIVLSADATKVIMRQTQIVRTDRGIQLFLRGFDNFVYGLQLDINYWMNILRVRASTNNSTIKTQAYVLDYNPEETNMRDKAKPENKKYYEDRENLRQALKQVFKFNSAELLKAYFPHRRFELDHNLKTNEFAVKLLTQRIISTDESHLVKIRPPGNPARPDLNPKDSEVTLYSNRKGRLVGRDVIGFISDIVDGLFKKTNFISRVNSPNPADSPFGKAQWRMVTNDTDLSEKREQLPNVAIVQNVWGGWKLKRKDFLELIDKIRDQFRETPVPGVDTDLINREAFTHVKSVEFYRITANLSIFKAGLDKLTEFMTKSHREGDNKKTRMDEATNPITFLLGGLSIIIGKPIEALASIFGKDRYNYSYIASDKKFIEEFVTFLGGGDYAKGRRFMEDYCNYYLNENKCMENPTFFNHSFTGLYLRAISDLVFYKRNFPENDPVLQAQWRTRLLYTLQESIPMPILLNFLGRENYIFFIRINGFRTGDEDADLEYFSNSIGDPVKNFETAAGLLNYYANKMRISPAEVVRTNGGFR